MHNVMYSSIRTKHPEYIQQDVLMNVTVQEYLKLQGMWKRGTIRLYVYTQTSLSHHIQIKYFKRKSAVSFPICTMS
jgi:hypothetical protein